MPTEVDQYHTSQEEAQMKSDDSYTSGSDASSYYSGDSDSEYSQNSDATGSLEGTKDHNIEKDDIEETVDAHVGKNEFFQSNEASPMSLEESEDRNDLITEKEQRSIEESAMDREVVVSPDGSESSKEESIVLKISNEEEVVIQLSNEEKQEKTETEAGIELEMISAPLDIQNDFQENGNEVQQDHEERVEDYNQNDHLEDEQSTHEKNIEDQNMEENIPMSLSDDEKYSSVSSSNEDGEEVEEDLEGAHTEEQQEEEEEEEEEEVENQRDDGGYDDNENKSNHDTEEEKVDSPTEREILTQADPDELEKQVEIKNVNSNDNPEVEDSVTKSIDQVSNDRFDLKEAFLEIYATKFFPLPKRKAIDDGISIVVEEKIERDDVIFENFGNLRKKRVKTNAVWWMDNSDVQVETRFDEKHVNLEPSSDDWFIEQFKEAENSASELDVDALNVRLEAERSKKVSKVKKIWWKVDNASKPNYLPLSHDKIQWFFNSMIEQENKPGLMNVEKDRKAQAGKRSWLTEQDRNDEKKLAVYIADKSHKRDLDIDDSNEGKDLAKSSEVHKETTVESGRNTNDNEESEDESVKKDETIKTRHGSIVDVIEEVVKGITNKIDGINIVHDDGDGDVIVFKDTLNFTGLAQKSRTTKEILKKNSKKSKKLKVQLDTPSQKIQDLIEGAMESSISRRSNACGTIKLLATKKTNVPMLIKSAGLIKALVFVLREEYSEDEIEASQSSQLRALATLAILSQPKEGRRIICEEEGLLEALSNIMTKGASEVCLHACSIIAALTKTEENREIIMSKKGLLRKLSLILRNAEEKVDDRLDKADSKSKDPDDDTDEDESNTDNSEDFKKTSEKQINAIRLNACAALLHLSKHCAVTVSF